MAPSSASLVSRFACVAVIAWTLLSIAVCAKCPLGFGSATAERSPAAAPVVLRDGSGSYLGGAYNFSFVEFPEEGYVHFTVSANTTGWVGFGFALNPGTMLLADAIIAWVDDGNGTVSVDDYSLRGYFFGCDNGVCADTSLGGVMNAFNVTGSQSGGVTTISFSRNYVTGDVYDNAMVSGVNEILVAYGPSDGPSLTKHTDKTGATMSLTGAPVGSTTSTTATSSDVVGAAMSLWSLMNL